MANQAELDELRWTAALTQGVQDIDAAQALVVEVEKALGEAPEGGVHPGELVRMQRELSGAMQTFRQLRTLLEGPPEGRDVAHVETKVATVHRRLQELYGLVEAALEARAAQRAEAQAAE